MGPMNLRTPLLSCALAAGLGACTTHSSPSLDDGAMAQWVDDFNRSPKPTLDRLAAVSDTQERDLIILSVLAATPSMARALCPMASQPETADHCDKLSKRPHLFNGPPGGGPGGGPPPRRPTGEPQPLQTYQPRWKGLDADPGSCLDNPDRVRCLTVDGVALATAGKPLVAASRCLAVPAGNSRSDCFFQSAEAAQLHRSDLPAAVDLCAGAGDFTRECLSHLHAALEEQFTDLSPAEAAPALKARLGTLSTFWNQTDPTMVSAATAQLLYSAAPRLLGPQGLTAETRAAMPAAVLPHIHTHIGLSVAMLADPFGTASAVAAGHAALPPLDASVFRWSVDGQSAPSAQRVSMGATPRVRPSDPDPDHDLELAVATALTDLNTPRNPLINQARHLTAPERGWFTEQSQPDQRRPRK